MSSNQKQTAAGGPQTQRYTSSPYQPIPPPVSGSEYDYFRPDGYPVSTPPGTYVQPPPNQGGNQAPALRGPSVPPNQSSTPPNAADLKVQTLSQPMFTAVRQPGAFYTRATGPPSQPQRMANHNPRQSTYIPQHFMQVAAPPMYLPNSVQYYGTQRPTASFVPQVPVYQHITTTYPYNNPQTQTPPVPFYNFQPPMMQRTGTIPQPPPANPNTTQNAMPNVSLVASNHHQTFPKPPRRRPKAISIIDPDTGADRLNELFEDSSHPPSGESSARQTPQPSAANKEVQATFAKQVMQALNNDTASSSEPQHHHQYVPPPPQDDHHSEIQTDGVGVGGHQQANHVVHEQGYVAGPPIHQVQQQQQHQMKMDQVVQSSTLQAEAKEFFLPHPTAKETPIVSANIDAVEVTLPNKLPKDRESPVKGRKQRIGEHKDSGKEVTTVVAAPKDVISDSKESSIVAKEEVKSSQELSPPTNTNPSTNSTQVPYVSKDTGATPAKEVIAQAQDRPHRPQQQQQQPPQQHRKDAKETGPKVLERQDSGPIAGTAAPAQDAKSKQNAQRSASKQGSGGPTNQNNQKPISNPVSVPQPQPAKPASKSNKKNELNLKGANKEGTDMDAFNDNAVREEVNSNVIPTQIINNNDIINANSIPPPTTNSTPAVTAAAPPLNQTHNAAPDVAAVNANVAAETNNKKSEEIPTKSEPVTAAKPLFKTKIDITDIVRDKPKNIKPYSSSTIGGADETDRASPLVQSNEKMVQAKNDVNAKTSEISRIENKLPYADGQWSPANQNGAKKYQKEFLIALRDVPASRVVPDKIPESVLADERGRITDGRLSMGGRADFAPTFNTYRNSSQKGSLPSRPSGSKMERGKGGSKSSTAKQMKVSISVREEVKLHESENAWRPARFNKGETATDEDKKTEELYKKVRGILNKLTPQKFDTLLQQIRTLSIDNTERLQGVIDLVFEKAIDEPNFSVAYASMCGHLALLQVPTSQCTEEKPDFVNFRKLLVTRCQQEFEKQSIDESVTNQKLVEIEACTDPEKKKDLEFELDEYFRRLRMKSVGNTRFIGELFKQNMLTQSIMTRCLNKLLEHKDEESLECLCKLLTTVGKELESKGVNLSAIFGQMKALSDRKDSTKISSRIRFMLQDVIDLRNSKWVPRRQDLNPRMIDQIQKEAEQEQMNIQMMNAVPMTPRKDERGGGGGGSSSQGSMSDRKGRGRNVSEDGWSVQNNKNKFTFQREKMQAAGKAPVVEELGNPAQFKWHLNQGASAKPAPQQSSNMYAPLENFDADKRSNTRPGQKDYYSKGTSLERSGYKYDSRGGSRSGSQHRSNDSSGASSQRTTPAPPASISLQPQHYAPQQAPKMQQQQQKQQAAPVPTAAPVAPAPQVEQLTDTQRHRRIMNSLDEYVSGNCTVDEYFADISSAVPTNLFPTMVMDSYLHILEKSQQVRLKSGGLFAKLVVQGKIPLDSYCAGLEELLSQADDLKIDIPKIWDYLAEILVDLVCEEALPLKRLHRTMRILIEQEQADKLLAPLFKLVVSNKGTSFLQNQWHLSHLRFSDFVKQSLVETFIKDNQFQFLLGGPTPVGLNHLSYEDIQTKLSGFLRAGQSIDEIHDWVTANVGDEGVKENKFVRALATAIFEDSITKHFKLDTDRLEQHTKLLHKYVDNNPAFELECLYALQALVNKMEHPQGLLLGICDRLYELGTFSQESFVAWEESHDPAEQEGKGVALKQLTSFFCQLKENDDEESSCSDPEFEED